MVDRIIEERPTERVVVEDRDSTAAPRNNTGVIIALVILAIVVLVLLFGRGMFGGGDGVSTPDVNVTPSTSTGQ